MDKIFRTQDGGLVYVASNPSVISEEEQRERGMRPNGFPEGRPESICMETILCALKAQKTLEHTH